VFNRGGNMKFKKANIAEQEKILRVVYNPEDRPILKVGEQQFEVADISEMGLSFFKGKDEKFRHWVQGTVALLCGEAIDIEGMIVKKRTNAIYMNINVPIKQTTLLKEHHCIIER
jgi:hypothetical protein